MGSYPSVDSAVNEVLASISPLKWRDSVDTKGSMGRILADDFVSRSDSPEFSVSHMDGFAVVASDFGRKEKVVLRIAGQSNPESPSPVTVGKGETVRVSTGARIPEGADAVVPVEDVEEGHGVIQVKGDVRRGAFVYPAGADFRKGEVLIPAGKRLTAPDLALLLTLGTRQVEVMPRPRAAVLATGSELRDVDDAASGKVPNTHGPMFANMAKALGCLPTDLGVTSDDKSAIKKTIGRALQSNDLVLTLGGTSVGRRDMVPGVVEGLAPDVFHHGLRMDRGRVSGVAVVKGKPIVMLPGPAQGAMNAFLLLATPVVEKLQGGANSRVTVTAELTSGWKARRRFKDFTKVLYVRLNAGNRPKADPLVGETESITVLSKASGYVVVPERVTALRRGSTVAVNLLPGLSYAL